MELGAAMNARAAGQAYSRKKEERVGCLHVGQYSATERQGPRTTDNTAPPELGAGGEGRERTSWCVRQGGTPPSRTSAGTDANLHGPGTRIDAAHRRTATRNTATPA